MQTKPASSTGWKAVPSQAAETTAAVTGSSVPMRVDFIGPTRRMPCTKSVKDKAVPTRMIKATVSQPPASSSGVMPQACTPRQRAEPPMIMPAALTGTAPHWMASPWDRVG